MALPNASVDEVKQAILSSVDPIDGGGDFLAAGGRLNAEAAINAGVFSPTATLIDKEDITTSGGTSTEFTVQYQHRDGIDAGSLGDDDLIVSRQWGPNDEILPTLVPGSVIEDGSSVTATYSLHAPGDGVFRSANVPSDKQIRTITFSSDSPTEIPADGVASTEMTIDGITADAVEAVRVTLDFDHDFLGDIALGSLSAPSGTANLLDFEDTSAMESLGLSRVTFEDTSVVSPPIDNLMPLATNNPNGVWGLVLEDFGSSGGWLTEWSISFDVLVGVTYLLPVQEVSESIADFDIDLDVNTTSDAELTAILVSPRGDRTVLFSDLEQSGLGLRETTLSDSAVVPISDGSAPYSGKFLPQDEIASLGSMGPNGIWKLELISE